MSLCVCFRNKGSHPPRWLDRKSRWCDARCNLLAFQNKSDLFSEIWELAKPNIDELETEYQAKFPDDPLSVLREILIYVLETTVTEERRRLLMEIIFHKCEFVGEIASVQLVERSLCLENYDRIEKRYATVWMSTCCRKT